jgi:NAD-dependent epimerase/dehydratase family protein
MTTSPVCRGATILVTGAGGFLGSRIADRLVLEHGAGVRVLLRSLAGASKIATLPVEYRRGDVTDLAAVTDAAKGCDVVMHCASRIEPGVALKRPQPSWAPGAWRTRALRSGPNSFISVPPPSMAFPRHPSWMKRPLIGPGTERTPTRWPRSPRSDSCNNAVRIAVSRLRYSNPQ